MKKEGCNERNIYGGFRETSIYLVNKEEVLKLVPDQEKSDVDNIEKCWTAAFSRLLEERRAQLYVRRKRILRAHSE